MFFDFLLLFSSKVISQIIANHQHKSLLLKKLLSWEKQGKEFQGNTK